MTPHALVTVFIGACSLILAPASAFSAAHSRAGTASLNAGAVPTRLRSTGGGDDDHGGVAILSSRREALLQSATKATSVFVATAALSSPAYAGIDPAALKALPVEGELVGSEEPTHKF